MVTPGVHHRQCRSSQPTDYVKFSKCIHIFLALYIIYLYFHQSTNTRQIAIKIFLRKLDSTINIFYCILMIPFFNLNVHLFLLVAFLGDIALDEEDLLMFREAHTTEDDQQRVQSNRTDSGVRDGESRIKSSNNQNCLIFTLRHY